jgi:hypothetical protein
LGHLYVQAARKDARLISSAKNICFNLDLKKEQLNIGILSNRIKRALELRRKGLSFLKIGEDLGIGKEGARQMVRKYEGRLKTLEDPFALKIKELSRIGEATRILNALNGNEVYGGDPEKLSKCKPADLRKIQGLGPKSVSVIAKAIEGLGVIGDAEEWLK